MPKLKFRNKEVFYEIYGDGAPIVLLHGFGENRTVFSSQTETLKKKFRIIVPDLPGSGNSEEWSSQPELDDFADTVNAIVEKELSQQKFHLFGHSMGGYTTMAFADRYPEKLLSFGLLHSSAFGDTTQKIEIRTRAINFIRKKGGQTFLKTITADLFSEKSRNERPELVQQLLHLGIGITDETLIRYYNAMINRPDRTHVLKSATIPVLFIIGKFDNVIPLELSLQQSEYPRNASVHVLNHSGHMGMWEETALFNELLESFLNHF